MKPRNLILQLSLKPDFEKFTNVIMGRLSNHEGRLSKTLQQLQHVQAEMATSEKQPNSGLDT